MLYSTTKPQISSRSVWNVVCVLRFNLKFWHIQIDVPSFSGAFGILPSHVPTLAVLKPGVVTVYEEDGAVKKIFVSSGSVFINQDASVQILAEEAHPVEDIDGAAARDILAKAQAKVSSTADEVRNVCRNISSQYLLIMYLQAAKAEAMIEVEVAEALVAAAQ